MAELGRGMMDTSPEYIKMCRQAKEIQEIGKKYRFDTKAYWHKWTVWLPRQDQLWKIHCDNNIWRNINELYDFINSDNFDEYSPVDSIEKLLLVFIMHVKFDKTWDGTGWIRNEL